MDESIVYGGCSNDTKGALAVTIGAWSMLGGYAINVSGPCIRETDTIRVNMDVTLDCVRINMVVARCWIPVDYMNFQGFQVIKMSVDGGVTYPFHRTCYLSKK